MSYRVAMKGLPVILVLSLATVAGLCGAEPVRLALMPANPELVAATDVLTVEFTRAGVELLERAEIDKVYREQATAASAKDFLKLGQLLGADGVLILELAREGEKQILSARLAAVKPGVVLRQRNYPWPLENLADWSRVAAGQFRPLLPKLGVLPKDALPISILNLRSAVRSPEAEAMERDLTLLVQNRLAQEREVFVLERRRLGTLAEEKELKPEQDVRFWNGSYLFEGTIDRAGFTAAEATINARLIPPSGASPTDVEVVQTRTNLVAMADGLVSKILEALRRKSNAPEWNPAEEAARYLEEARWALRWKMFAEAQAASDAAWAMGKRDLDCALVRVKSYVEVVPPDTGGYQHGSSGYGTIKSEHMRQFLDALKKSHPGTLAYVQRGATLDYTYVERLPNPTSLDRAIHSLSLYSEFAGALSVNARPVDKLWYELGLQAIEAASEVLEHFHFVQKSQPPVAARLADLRSLVRSVAGWLSQVERHAEGRDFVLTQIEWGCFWQEKPDETTALYCELASRAGLAAVNHPLWFRPLQRPRLAAWSAEDQLRIPDAWNRYVRGLEGSSNGIMRIEGKLLVLADVVSAKLARPIFEEVVELILSHRREIVSNTVDMLSLDWHLADIISKLEGSVITPEKEVLHQWFAAEVRPILLAMREEHNLNKDRMIEERKSFEDFEAQRRFLAERTPYEFVRFSKLFLHRGYSPAHAAELKPLLATYRSNLVAHSSAKTGADPTRARMALGQIDLVAGQFTQILNRPLLVAKTGNMPLTNHQTATAEPAPVPPRQSAVFVDNVLGVTRFIKLPVEHLTAEQVSELFIFAHRWREGRLWLDLRYVDHGSHGPHPFRGAAVAFEPRANQWLVCQYEDDPSRAPVGSIGDSETTLHFEVVGNVLYLSKWDSMKKYDLGTRRWETFEFPGQKLAQVHALKGHLYAANEESIFEIMDSGRSTRVLASCRRRPAVTVLDNFEKLSGNLFEGPNGVLQTLVGSKVFAWDGHDWKAWMTLGQARAEVFDGCTVLRSMPDWGIPQIWMISSSKAAPELCWEDGEQAGGALMPSRPTRAWHRPDPPRLNPFPTWSRSNELSLAFAPMTLVESNLCFFVPHSGLTDSGNTFVLAEKDGRHANLIWLERGRAVPLIVPLRFELSNGAWTTDQMLLRSGRAISPAKTWLVATAEELLIGQVGTAGIWSIPITELYAAVARERIAAQ